VNYIEDTFPKKLNKENKALISTLKESALKILNLIIYNENEEYERQMKVELEIYLEQFENNVVFYFIAYRETQQDDIMIENNCIYIKGKEGFVPQVLDKTIIALEYCIKYLNINFDFFVRSNISSVINFNLFPINELNYDNVYTGPYVLKLDWLDPPYGINSKNIHKLKGTKYAQGTCIILSKDVCDYLLYHQKELDRTVIDDVSIGFLLSKIFKTSQIKKDKIYIVNTIDNDAFVIRNKTKDRYDDVFRMCKINNFKTLKDLKDGLTFIIPTIGRKTLKYTIESLQNLNIQDWKAIILFDGIKPTLEVEDDRFKIITLKKTGKLNYAGNVRNQGIKIADTKWVGFVDDDDTLLPNYLDIFKDIVNNSNPDIIIFRMLNSDGRILPPKKDKDFSINNVGISFCLQKKHMIENNIWFTPSSTEDFDLLNKFRNIGKNIVISKDITYIVRHIEPKIIFNFSAYTYTNFIENYKNINISKIIPKLMFRMCPFDLLSIPNEINTVLNSFFKLNPEYVQVYLDNDDCIQFIKDYYPQYFEHYNNIIPGAYKSDICRLLLLYEFGGFYSDIGQTFKYPLSKFIDEDDEVVFSIENKPYTNIFNNSFMAFYPKHPLLNYMIKSVIDNVSSKYYGVDNIDITGPRALGKSFNSFFNRLPISDINTGKHKINNFKFNVFIADYPNNKIIDKKQNELAELKFPNYMTVMYKDKGKYYKNLWDKRKVYVNE
jgi:hypothetical protein